MRWPNKCATQSVWVLTFRRFWADSGVMNTGSARFFNFGPMTFGQQHC
jgi:uncharacterized membrane protein